MQIFEATSTLVLATPTHNQKWCVLSSLLCSRASSQSEFAQKHLQVSYSQNSFFAVYELEMGGGGGSIKTRVSHRNENLWLPGLHPTSANVHVHTYTYRSNLLKCTLSCMSCLVILSMAHHHWLTSFWPGTAGNDQRRSKSLYAHDCPCIVTEFSILLAIYS